MLQQIQTMQGNVESLQGVVVKHDQEIILRRTEIQKIDKEIRQEVQEVSSGLFELRVNPSAAQNDKQQVSGDNTEIVR